MAVLWEFDCQKIQQRNTSSSYSEKQNPRLDIFCFVFQNVVCFIWHQIPIRESRQKMALPHQDLMEFQMEQRLRTILLHNSFECQNTCYAITLEGL